MKNEVSSGRGVPLDDQEEIQTGNRTQDLKDVISWLLLNGMKSERTQANMLVCQNVANIWKKSAYRSMLKLDDSSLLAGGGKKLKLSTLLSAWKEETDTTIPNSIPDSISLKRRLEKVIAEKKLEGLLHAIEDQKSVDEIMNTEFQNENQPLRSEDTAISLEGEQVQEQEQEQVFV